jgi:hypothetical protein
MAHLVACNYLSVIANAVTNWGSTSYWGSSMAVDEKF